MAEKIQLPGGPDQSVTRIWLENGTLKMEYYDFSEPAQNFFSNDIPWMEHYFKGYFGIKQWLEEHEIGFSIERESRA